MMFAVLAAPSVCSACFFLQGWNNVTIELWTHARYAQHMAAADDSGISQCMHACSLLHIQNRQKLEAWCILVSSHCQHGTGMTWQIQ